ncbi:hypothetical protein FND36_06635 [Lachnospiraceae bacterium KGMB03038]|nr:hypothetical protein FND36_06635 [Lachnospiraceae bacterium KGMB03038]
MYEDCPAKLKMERMILKDGFFDETVHHCKVISYHPEREMVYLLTGKTELPVFSLDALYTCIIETEEEAICCEGQIRERYWSKLGRVIVFHIQNGFYKNLVK